MRAGGDVPHLQLERSGPSGLDPDQIAASRNRASCNSAAAKDLAIEARRIAEQMRMRPELFSRFAGLKSNVSIESTGAEIDPSERPDSRALPAP
jgi:hypothetical protein